MPIPASLTPITITCTYPQVNGVAAQGTVQFVLSAPSGVPIDGAIVPSTPVTAVLNATGSLKASDGSPLVLPATNDPDWAVSGLTYQVTERIVGTLPRTYNIAVPVNSAGGTLNLAAVAPAVPGTPLTSYVLAATVGAASGVASLDATGKVPAAQIPATGSVPDASPTAKGVVKLAGDLSGTADLPTVVGLAGKATDTAVVHLAGPETITGIKTFSLAPVVPAAAFPETAVANLTTDLAAKASKPIVRSAYITTGDITLTNVGATWTALAGLELALPAAVGDHVDLDPSFMHNSAGGDFFDMAVLVGTAIVRRSSTGTANAPTSGEGDPALYPNATNSTFRTSGARFWLTVQAGDLDGANVRFVLIARGTGGTKVYASANYPFRWRAKNSGPVN